MGLCTSLHGLLSGFIRHAEAMENDHPGLSGHVPEEKQEQRGLDMAFLDSFIASRKKTIENLYLNLEQIKMEISSETQRLMPLRIDLSRCLYPEDRELVLLEIETIKNTVAECREKFKQLHAKVRVLVAFVQKADLVKMRIAATHDSEDIRELIVLASEVADDEEDKAVLLNILNDKCKVPCK